MNTSWVEQDSEWEGRVKAWATGLLVHEAFLADFVPFAERVAIRGREVSLGQVLLKLTSPGVPDIYGGDEVEFLALVDPDNRRPVDWRALRAALDSAEPPPKLDLIRRTLALRERRPAAFAGSYEPLDAGEHTCAFVRGGDVLVAVALRGLARSARRDVSAAARTSSALTDRTCSRDDRSEPSRGTLTPLPEASWPP